MDLRVHGALWVYNNKAHHSFIFYGISANTCSGNFMFKSVNEVSRGSRHDKPEASDTSRDSFLIAS